MIYLATIAALITVWLIVWFRYRDPFHPLIVLLPLLAFLYGYMPFELQSSDPDRFWYYAGGEAVYRYQAIAILLIGSLIAGVFAATYRVAPGSRVWLPLDLRDARYVRRLAAALGGLGFAAWLYMVFASGGFTEAYGEAYGGGWVQNGYIRELRFAGLLGVPLIFVLRYRRGMRPADWALIALCLAPTLIHGILGARRGPVFLSALMLGGGYFYLLRKRLPLPVLLGGGLALGLLLLFLVANRSSIYLGTEGVDFRDPLDFVLRWESNEYLIGGTVVRYADQHGSYYGFRELVWLIGRFVPVFIWPSAFRDLPIFFGIDVDVTVNGGVSQQGITTIANWTPSVGSAEGFVGSLWLELGWMAPIGAFAIGLFYGRFWKLAAFTVRHRVLHLLALGLSIYLVMQSLDPWLYRMLLLGVPIYFLLRRVRVVPVPTLSDAERREPMPSATWAWRERARHR